MLVLLNSLCDGNVALETNRDKQPSAVTLRTWGFRNMSNSTYEGPNQQNETHNLLAVRPWFEDVLNKFATWLLHHTVIWLSMSMFGCRMLTHAEQRLFLTSRRETVNLIQLVLISTNCELWTLLAGDLALRPLRLSVLEKPQYCWLSFSSFFCPNAEDFLKSFCIAWEKNLFSVTQLSKAQLFFTVCGFSVVVSFMKEPENYICLYTYI